MPAIGYSGDIRLAVVLQFKGDRVANPLSSAASYRDFRYIIANESLDRFDIKAVLGGHEYGLRRRASSGARFFDSALNCYTTSPFSGAILDTLVNDASTSWRITFRFTYRTFFDQLLAHIGLTDATENNLADPADSAAILGTFTRSGGSQVRIRYDSATEEVRDLPVELKDVQVTPRGIGNPPAVKLVFELDFLTGINEAKRTAMRRLLAMDHSKLARYGRFVSSPPVFVTTWDNNVRNWLINHTDIDRGRRFLQSLVDGHKARTAADLSTHLRNAIDAKLVTANHWGERREDIRTERHQRFLSDLFGTLHQQTWLSSPVHFQREISDELGFDIEDDAAMALQFGTGHCGEHAQVSFTILKKIAQTPGSHVSNVVQTGNANIDHAFVVYQLDVTTVVITTIASPRNTARNVGDDIRVWNLRDAISRNAPRDGFVMDPYLDVTVMRPRASQLLAALNNGRRRASGKDTDWLWFGREHPDSFVEDDIRGEPVAVRRARVPNV